MAIAEPRPGTVGARAKGELVSVPHQHLPGLGARVEQRRNRRRAAQIRLAGELKGQLWLLDEPVDRHLGCLGRRRPGLVRPLPGLEPIGRQSSLPFDADAGEAVPMHEVAPVVSKVGKRRMELETSDGLRPAEMLDKVIPRGIIIIAEVRKLPHVYKTGRRCEEINVAADFEWEAAKQRKALRGGGFGHAVLFGWLGYRAMATPPCWLS